MRGSPSGTPRRPRSEGRVRHHGEELEQGTEDQDRGRALPEGGERQGGEAAQNPRRRDRCPTSDAIRDERSSGAAEQRANVHDHRVEQAATRCSRARRAASASGNFSVTCEPNAITRCNADRDGATQHTGWNTAAGEECSGSGGRSAGVSRTVALGVSGRTERVRGQDGEGPVGLVNASLREQPPRVSGKPPPVEDHEEGGQREEHEGPPPDRVVAAEWHGERAEQEQEQPRRR